PAACFVSGTSSPPGAPAAAELRLPVPVLARERQAAAAAVGFDQQALMQAGGAIAETVRDRRQVNPVDAVTYLVGGGDRLGLPGLEPPRPVLQRQRVMLAQVLDVADVEPSFLGLDQQLRHRPQLPVGKDVAAAERPPFRLRDHRTGADAVTEEDTARRQQPPSELKVTWQ